MASCGTRAGIDFPHKGMSTTTPDPSARKLLTAFGRVDEAIKVVRQGDVDHNTRPKPFIWAKSARDILQKVIRANSRLSAKQNATLH